GNQTLRCRDAFNYASRQCNCQGASARSALARDFRSFLPCFGETDRDRLFAARDPSALAAATALQRAAFAAPHRALDALAGLPSISWHHVLPCFRRDPLPPW